MSPAARAVSSQRAQASEAQGFLNSSVRLFHRPGRHYGALFVESGGIRNTEIVPESSWIPLPLGLVYGSLLPFGTSFLNMTRVRVLGPSRGLPFPAPRPWATPG